jgi:hypothetical protein
MRSGLIRNSSFPHPLESIDGQFTGLSGLPLPLRNDFAELPFQCQYKLRKVDLSRAARTP